MVKVPPGSAKSTYFSVLLPPWFLCNRPRSTLLAASHSVDLAESFGRKARNLIDANSRFLGYSLSPHSKAAGRWETSNGGGYLAAGVGTAIAGYRADFGLLDDPIGSREDADSKLMRDKVWDWWHFDFKTRLKPNAVIIFIYTPWHEDDLGHRVLAEEGDLWTQVELPFFARANDPLQRAEGEILWPEWFKPDMFPKDPRVASALYQLRPTPEEGDFFRREWLVEYQPSQLPATLRMYCASDHALSTKEQADKTLLVPFGVDANDDIWILPDFYWGRCDTHQTVERMIAMAQTHKPLAWFAGKEHITSSIGPFLRKRMAEAKTFFLLQESVSRKDKVTRCGSIRGRMAQKKVHFPVTGQWHEVKHELLSFPVGVHDEWPDVLGEIGRGLDEFSHPAGPAVPELDLVSAINKPWKPTMSWLRKLDRERELSEATKYGDR